MKNVEVLSINQVVQSIPTSVEDRTLSTEDKAQLIILKYHFQRAADLFENEMQEIVKSLKPEGFDALAQKVQASKDPEGTSAPTLTDEEQSTYDSQLKALNEEYGKARAARLMEDCDTPRHIPYSLFTAVVALIGDSTIEINKDQEISSTQALFMLAALLEEKDGKEQ